MAIARVDRAEGIRMHTSTTKKLLKNSSGQFVIEAVLLMTVTMGLIIFATRMIKEEKWISKLATSQWGKIAGMLEAGVWENPDGAKKMHPNQIDRHRTPFPRKN